MSVFPAVSAGKNQPNQVGKMLNNSKNFNFQAVMTFICIF